MSEGLSHIVLHACTPDDFELTRQFYTSFGFEALQDEADGNTTWLKLKASSKTTTDITLKLTLRALAVRRARPASDADWSLEETALVLATHDLADVKVKLETMGALYQDRPIQMSIYALDPLENLVVFASTQQDSDDDGFVTAAQSATDTNVATDPSCSSAVHHAKRIGVLTSGGDSPGMNACVRAVVRYGISKGCEVYAIYEGYQGLVDGGERICKMDWKSVRGWLGVGGTSIGTARCMEFKTREGRLKSAENLVKHGIDALIVCGGDGSLTGADVLRSEWSGLLEELRSLDRITDQEVDTYRHLTIVGLVGSIDNDMSGTDMTIGAVTSLQRICEAVDSIHTTALSHSRAFVVEVMGRHCGWLALMAGIASGADFVFIPERPPTEDDWETAMCKVANRHRKLGKRKTVIIVAEGAIDKYLKPIKAEHIKNVLTEQLKLDTRVTTLGHTQRGGSPAAYDRILATIQSVEAVDAVLRATPDTPSPLIGMCSNKVTTGPLMQAVELTHEVAKAISEKNFRRAMELRDPEFADEFEAYNASTILDDQSMVVPEHQRLNIAIVHVGAPAGGMNAATRTAVRCALNRGHRAFGVYNGFPGLVRGTIEELTWISVDGWGTLGGSQLGTNRSVPGIQVDLGMIAYQVQQHNIQALMLVGGFEAFSSLIKLEEARARYPSLCIPICHIPATVSNNVPGTDFSLGSDTSLNSIVEACDAIVQSARSSRRRVFVVEVQGGKTGYLAVEAGIATGANMIYIPEEGITLSRLQSDVKHLMALYLDDDEDKSEGRIILRTEGVSDTYTTDVISNILKDEGHHLFDSRTAVLGHIQQGGIPSPMDRIRATRLAKRAIEFFERHTSKALNEAHEAGHSIPPVELAHSPESVAVVGISGDGITFRSVQELLPVTDMKNRKPRAAWWYEHRPLVDLLTGRGLFTPEAQAQIHGSGMKK
ncbi:6-phosphofructokinase [Dichotomocladium elegans]|nr:6-phosphofructokinase [Dichotomocladium elegans]